MDDKANPPTVFKDMERAGRLPTRPLWVFFFKLPESDRRLIALFFGALRRDDFHFAPMLADLRLDDCRTNDKTGTSPRACPFGLLDLMVLASLSAASMLDRPCGAPTSNKTAARTLLQSLDDGVIPNRS